MITINEIFRAFGPQCLERYAQTMPKIHIKVIRAIIGCRTESCGLVLYTKPRSRRLRTMVLDAMEFIRRFLQHVLPIGFMKVRYYGFMNPNCSVPFEKISTLIQMAYSFVLKIPIYPESTLEPLFCPHCGGTLHYLRFFLPGLSPQVNLDSS